MSVKICGKTQGFHLFIMLMLRRIRGTLLSIVMIWAEVTGVQHLQHINYRNNGYQIKHHSFHIYIISFRRVNKCKLELPALIDATNAIISQ